MMLRFIVLLLLAVLAAGCNRTEPQTIVITATFDPLSYTPPAQTPPPITEIPTEFVPNIDLIAPTPDATRLSNIAIVDEYIVQPGDTLSGIAAQFGVSVDTLQEVNGLENPDLLDVGQVLRLPEAPTEQGSDFKIVPDSRLVRSPSSRNFDITGFIQQQPGYIAVATDEVDEQILTAAQVVERVSLEFSVDARLLLALIELKTNWLSQRDLDTEARIYPMRAPASPFGVDRNGLYRQLAWAADQLNAGYYGWKQRNWSTITFEDSTRLIIAPSLNAASVGVQHILSLYSDYFTWRDQVSVNGLYAIYVRYFGDPFAEAIEPLVPPTLIQPELTFPFSSGEVWFYTGSHHGGYGSGSAWSAIDFAPPDERPEGSATCYVSDFFATAVANGVIARSRNGSVVLDLDGDGDETTGWTILYLHIDTTDRVAVGTNVAVGDRIGRPSCEGGFSTGTHLHIARRYNGEWIPASCDACPPDQPRPPFVMSGWSVAGIPNQEYQGYLVNGSDERIAEQGRLIAENRVSW